MLPSEILRKNISQKYNIDLEKYAWSDEIREKIFSIKLEKDLEESTNTLKDIYFYGFNIGHCGLTSRYIAINFDTAKLYYGKAKLLIGTDNAPNGEHAWTIINNYLVDTSLMISVPIDKIHELGYIPEKEIAYDSARILSEFDIYEHEFKKNNHIKQK